MIHDKNVFDPMSLFEIVCTFLELDHKVAITDKKGTSNSCMTIQTPVYLLYILLLCEFWINNKDSRMTNYVSDMHLKSP